MVGGLKLKHKIYAGYLSVGFVAVLIALVSYYSFGNVSRNFRHFTDFSVKAQIDFQLAQRVSEMQRQALIFTYEGHDSAAEQVHYLYNIMTELIQHYSGEELKYTNIINIHLKSYMAAFEKLQQQRQLQHTLVYDDLRQAASSTESHLRSQIKQVYQKNGDKQRFEIQRVLNNLLLIEKNAMRYFDSLDQSFIVKVEGSFSEVRTRLRELHGGNEQQDVRMLITDIGRDLDKYESIFLEAVQRTRGYLFLVNVVMSAEAYEALYNARQMSDQIKNKMADIERLTLSTLQSVSYIVAAAIVVAFFLIVLLSLLIGRSITIPIVRLTTAFNTLSTGSHQEDIPAYNVDDEIGDLTKAASIFKEKNRQTEELLSQAKEMTEELASNKVELERSNDELGQFVYTVSHDLKSPLVTSMGFIGIIQKLSKQGRLEEAIGKLDKVVKSNERMGQLINDLLELSRVGRIDMDKVHLDLNELLARFHSAHSHQLEEAGFTLNIDANLPQLYANESRILQVFENLLSNALKYASNPEGSIISIGSKEQEDAHLIWFRDNGRGIPEEFQKKVFGLFYRLSADTEGTGIGLAVAAKVMKFHHGEIWVESTPEKGATFWLRFNKHDKEDIHD